MELRASHQDRSLEQAIRFLKQHETSKGDWLITATVQNPGTPEEQRIPLVDLSWASDTWWKFMTGQSKRSEYPEKVLRRHFEMGQSGVCGTKVNEPRYPRKAVEI